MGLVIITGVLFVITVLLAITEAVCEKSWPRYMFKYVVWMGLPFIAFLAMYLGSA